MCQRVYVASAFELPAIRRSAKSPYLDVHPVTGTSPVRASLRQDLPFLYLAGAHLECGCGFPDEPSGPDGKRTKLDPADVKSLAALADFLRPACGKYATVQLYLCWAGQESDPPEGHRRVSLDELRQPAFRLKHKQLLTVGRTLHGRRRRTRG